MINALVSQNISLQSLIAVFNTISIQSNDMYCIAAPDFKHCFYVSSSYEDHFGFSRKALLKDIRYWESGLLPSDLKNNRPLLELAKQIRKDGEPKSYEDKYRIRTPEGEIKWLEDKSLSLYSSNGEYIGICGIARDVTCQESLQGFSVALADFPENDISRYFLKGKNKNVYLTSREAECAFYLLKGNTAKDTGKTLGISPRTVEDLLQKIKNKLNVKYQSELIMELIESQFIHLFDNTSHSPG